MNAATRLQKALKASGFKSKLALAKASGIPQPTISRIINGITTAPELATLQRLAKPLGVPVEWLAYGIGKPVKAVDAAEVPVSAVAVRKVKLSAQAGVSGFTIDEESEDDAPIFFRSDWLRKKGLRPADIVAIDVKGHSMDPTICDGDTIVIDTADREPADGSIYVCRYEGEIVVKRLKRDAGVWYLSSDNPDKNRYGRKEFAGEYAEILGKVFYRQTERL